MPAAIQHRNERARNYATAMRATVKHDPEAYRKYLAEKSADNKRRYARCKAARLAKSGGKKQ